MSVRRSTARTSTMYTRVANTSFYNDTFSRGDRIASKSSMRSAAKRFVQTPVFDSSVAYYECFIENNHWQFDPKGRRPLTAVRSYP